MNASELIKREKNAWDSGIAFITDKVAFQMRNVIRMLRKNYWGVFEEINDPQTGRRKIWHPLTEYLVDSAVKNIDLDTRDIDLRAKKSSAQTYKTVLRQALRNYLEEINFGEMLDVAERQGAIDGTFVWKTWEEGGKLHTKLVDLLNFYIDPTVDSIREAESVIERSLMMPEEIAAMKSWINTKNLTGTSTFNRNDGQLPNVPSTTQGQVKMREVFERWGVMPKFLITNETKDKGIQIEGRIVASSNGTDWVVHLIEENTKKNADGSVWRPYEECWYQKIHGRWYGKGIAEKVMWLQVYLNTIMGIRLNRSVVQQLGLFKIRAGSNITPQMIGRLLSNGAIKVTDLEKDIAPLEFPESGIGESYNDEKNIIEWGQRNTGLFEPATGDQLPASQPATTTAIQSQSAQSQFTLIKEGMGMFLTRWLKNHVLPYVAKNITKGDVIRLTGEFDEIAQLDEWNVNRELCNQIDKATKKGKVIDVAEIEFERERAIARLKQSGSDRFITVDDGFDPTEYDVEIVITNEEINKATLLQTLTGMLNMVPPQAQMPIIKQIFDLSGLDANQFDLNQAQSMMQPQQPQQAPQGQMQPQPQPINAAATMTRPQPARAF